MAELHDALKNLSPVEWDDVPQDNLESYLTTAFNAGELIINSVPPVQNGTSFSNSKPHHSVPNSATSHKEMHPSAARSQPPHKAHEDLQKSWGKPMKFSEKDNPLHVAVHKMAGNDRHGSWFARRSVHEGLGFDKFKRAMMREFAESMAVVGGPGAGSVRGIAADRRLEQKDVKGIGRLEVFELSAQFPGPVSAREFITLLLTSDDGLTEKSAAEVAEGKKHFPRHFMIVSRPIDHPDAPSRPDYVRAQYESVELIREIPLSTARPKSTPYLPRRTSDLPKNTGEGYTVGSIGSLGDHSQASGASDTGEGDPELNPVEWIMVTRSDPGGGIPRFLVDRGTPEAMLGDVHKFFNWACGQKEIPGPDEDVESQNDGSAKANAVRKKEIAPSEVVSSEDAKGGDPVMIKGAVVAPAASAAQHDGGIMSSLTSALETGINAYAPTSVSAMVHQRLHGTDDEDTSSDSSDDSSVNSFLSASEMRHVSATAANVPGATEDLSVKSADLATPAGTNPKNMNRHEKDLQKLIQKRQKLDRDLAKKRETEQERLRNSQEKNETEAAKQREKIEKELKKTEEKHKKEIEKIEKKKAREARKVEEKRQKKDDQNKLSAVTRERDDFRSQIGLFKRESRLLTEQVADLQAMNTAMANKLSILGGPDALKLVQEQAGRDRTSSMRSTRSAASGESVAKSLDKNADAMF